VRAESAIWLSTLLVVPVLLALMLLMEWLEQRFAHRMVADEVAVAFSSASSAEELEEMIARSVAPLFSDAVR
jgi:Na+/H+-dicarboxylate symporter